ncbi:uncharacterized protein TOT_010000309 [Theileria orientalis strain Shintoku]|uniref:RRM domain-containing protein n=2 Tax=Theileria orientalis TaxID=68886 RepID=J4CC63_THEOR|nr:uncharacterized protein TOT_010000309 [Theileria orientalis strain Shintoku]PVC52309.1 hypothetical protein MACL_00000841 [Theileria orientalis]UKJ87828.1 hypothetical protein MACJ_000268 [Theileria orientalis]BAM38842.1 uncharacterized protein TOT_010000309 [Theileria orientalis strain Shintoku]|eukprot:XP_009689143.1 uncharacterized protein TOT_010000309 [Theileria orientalis strain Shintoku]
MATSLNENRRTLFVRGIAEDVDKDLLYAAFSQFGTILNLEIPKDKDKDKNKSIAFIEFEDEEDAKHAIFNRHNSELYGRVIKVSYSTHSHVHTTRHKAVWDDDINFNIKVNQDVQIQD